MEGLPLPYPSIAFRTQMSLRNAEKPSLSMPISLSVPTHQPQLGKGFPLFPQLPGQVWLCAFPHCMGTGFFSRLFPTCQGTMWAGTASAFLFHLSSPAQSRCLVNAWSVLEIHCWHAAEVNTNLLSHTGKMATKPPFPHSN